MSYKLIVGLEVHVELSTKTKMFCGCKNSFGAQPNSQCCPVCLGLPGSLPVLNKKVVESAVKAGIATNCTINHFSRLDRKNYFYPDLAKAYQISQHYMPICKDGNINLASGKKVNIKRIHIEEDAGKIIYQHGETLIDYNRSGVPLIEFVTAPDMNSAEEAVEFVSNLIQIVRYIGISDCRMEEGSVRCDVNISVSKDNEKLGTRVEIKNVNSLKNLKKAIEFEKERQIAILRSLNKVKMETRRFNDKTSATEAMRQKEEANDYRYFADPDLLPIRLSDQWVQQLKKDMPMPFDERLKIYVNEYNIPENDAKTILKYERVTSFFERASQGVKNKRLVANFILGEFFSTLKTEKEKQNFNVQISAADLKRISLLIEEKKMPLNMAKQRLEDSLKTGGLDLSCSLVSEEELTDLVQNILSNNMTIVNDYLKGKTFAVEPLVGMILKKSNGQADPTKVRKKVMAALNDYFVE